MKNYGKINNYVILKFQDMELINEINVHVKCTAFLVNDRTSYSVRSISMTYALTIKKFPTLQRSCFCTVPYEKDHVACFFLPEVHHEGTPWNSSLHKIHGFSPSTIFGQK